MPNNAPPSPDKIDGASYKLSVGPEVYVSPTSENKDAASKTKRQLSPGQSFPIPSGQFAFILTEETVKVPPNALAFISMRSKKVKFRGLVNVSGFHVDPGYHGQLVFSVFNAGPAPIHLARGDDCFLIWYASLNETSESIKRDRGFDSIPSELINPIAGEIQSFEGLLAKINENDEKLTARLNTVERDHAVVKWALAIIVGAVVTFSLRGCSLPRSLSSLPNATSVATSVAPVSPALSDLIAVHLTATRRLTADISPSADLLPSRPPTT